MPRADSQALVPGTPRDSGRAFRLERGQGGAGALEVRLSGRLAFDDAAALWTELQAQLRVDGNQTVRVDLGGLNAIDGGATALLVQAKWNLRAAGHRCSFAGESGAVKRLLDLYDSDDAPAAAAAPVRVGLLASVGDATVAAWREWQLALAFLGRLVLALGGVLKIPRSANWRELGPTMGRTGADAVPIVLLINFLIGFAMAFQSAIQLKQFGANIYVANLVGLSLTRELGPLMTAIILCGRSGAAFAAELGTMKVAEEIDALRTMGFGPLRFLVLPRVLALFLVLPILVLMGDFAGVVGGLVVGVLNLDLTLVAYLQQTLRALSVWDVAQGLIKSSVFGLAIGLIACHQGLAAAGGAEAVGRRTTGAVVTALLSLILIDAAFTLLFFELHL